MPKPKQVKFEPPKDVRVFWRASCCGPATKDADDTCGFCGEANRDCAQAFSESVRKHPDWVHDGNILGDGQDDPEEHEDRACGGCGFWCSGCGRFWAQDSCGGSSGEEHRAADNREMVVKDGLIYCVCGKQLMRQREF